MASKHISLSYSWSSRDCSHPSSSSAPFKIYSQLCHYFSQNQNGSASHSEQKPYNSLQVLAPFALRHQFPYPSLPLLPLLPLRLPPCPSYRPGKGWGSLFPQPWLLFPSIHTAPSPSSGLYQKSSSQWGTLTTNISCFPPPWFVFFPLDVITI